MNIVNSQALEHISPKQQFQIETKSKISIDVKTYGEIDYLITQDAMAKFSSNRDDSSLDQIWLLQHPPVYTLGTSCKQSTLNSSKINQVKSDRGGQITYHGPGQVVMYALLNLKRHNIGVKGLVTKLEQAAINALASIDILAERKADAPGVYVNQAKIAALGLRIRRGNSYHGVSLNVDMDLTPFSNIDPCGYKGLKVTQIAELKQQHTNIQNISSSLLNSFVELL